MATKKTAKSSKAKPKKAKAKKSKAKKAKARTAAASATTRYCYTKVGGDPMVSLWSDGFKVGETTEADAIARGIPPCG